MKPVKSFLLVAVFALGIFSDVLAQDKTFAQISLSVPGGGTATTPRNELILLVVEGSVISYDKSPIPSEGTVDYVNNLLKLNHASYLGVYTREGVKYGDVMRALDLLRGTTAKNIGVSAVSLAPGREP